MEQFYVTLPSSSSGTFYTNKQNKYRVKLAKDIRLDGPWEMALREMTYPRNWLTFDSSVVVSFIFRVNYVTGNKPTHDRDIDKYSFVLEDLDYRKETKLGEKQYYDIVEITLPRTNYKTVENICHSIDRTFQLTRQSYQLAYLDDERKMKLECREVNGTIYISGPVAMWLHKGATSEWVAGLGMKNKVYHDRGHLIICPGYTDQCDFPNDISAINVYSPTMKPVMVGEKYEALLRSVKVRGEPWTTVTELFERPYFHRVQDGYINSIEILLKDNKGNEIDFRKGEVICVLHFRKCPTWI